MSLRMKFLLSLCLLIFCCMSCQTYYVSVTREAIDRSSLASSFAKTPDPRQLDPPSGERLLIQWNLLSKDVHEDLICSLSLIYKNYEEETVHYKVDAKRDVISYFLLGDRYETTKGIMTYKVEILTKEGEVVKSFKHQLWTKLIKLDDL
ncbi:MAG: hypothetical protein S4CHLAM37_03690 [Chlamydiia bacterium]|nr:hypothetical protein [Chlamydiia bacterium]